MGEITEQFTEIDEVEEVTYSPEDTTQAKPAIFVLKPNPSVSESRLEEIALRAREVLQRTFGHEVKASLEHPVGIDENGHPIDDEDVWLVKLRWMVRSHGHVKDIRLNGRPVKPGLEEG